MNLKYVFLKVHKGNLGLIHTSHLDIKTNFVSEEKKVIFSYARDHYAQAILLSFK